MAQNGHGAPEELTLAEATREFKQFYDRNRPLVYRYFYPVMGRDTEEQTEEIFHRLFLDRVVLVDNRTRALRRWEPALWPACRQRLDEWKEAVGEAATLEPMIEQDEAADGEIPLTPQDIRRCWSRLNRAQRRCIRLQLDGHGAQEIGRILSLDVEEVQAQLGQAYQILRECAAEDEP